MVVTLAWLTEHSCRPEDCDLFRATWSDAVELSRAELLRAANLNLNLHWLGPKILEGEARQRFSDAVTRFVHATGPKRTAAAASPRVSTTTTWRNPAARPWRPMSPSTWRRCEPARPG